MRKIRQESSGDVMCYWMEQGLSDETGFINCYLTCWKFTCQLHFDNTCTSSDWFQEVVYVCSENQNTFWRLIYLTLILLHRIDSKTFVTILRIRKNNNRADLDSIYKKIKKVFKFWTTKEFIDNRIHTLVNDGKVMNKLNGNADSYYVNSELLGRSLQLRPATLVKRSLWHRCFPVDFVKFRKKKTFLQNISGRLLL